MSWLDDPDNAIRLFEEGRIDVPAFDLAEHVHLAWHYLQRMDAFEATRRFTAIPAAGSR